MRTKVPIVPKRGASHRAMTLIECIGVLAVLAVLAAALAPAAIRHLDVLASNQEAASMKVLGDALQASILGNRYIPNQTNWYSQVATQAGMDVGAVTNNLRNRARVFLADASGWFTNGLPYAQTYAGTPSAAVNARIMLVSSIGAAVPMSSGMPATNDFANLWGSAPGAVPTTTRRYAAALDSAKAIGVTLTYQYDGRSKEPHHPKSPYQKHVPKSS